MNGTYDGMIGLIQSNVVNTVYNFFPYASVRHEPGFMVPAPVPTFTPHIYSAKIHGEKKQGLDVLHLFTNFTPAMWLYWLIVLTLCSITSLIMKYSANENCSKFQICSEFADSFWDYFDLFVDMAPYSARVMSAAATLWTLICIAVYYGIHMVFMSTLSADLSVPGADKWIHKLDDLLYDPIHANVRPTIWSQTNMLDTLLSSAAGSKERELLDRAMNSNSVWKVENKGSLLSSWMDIVKDTANRTRAIIDDDTFTDLSVGTGMCHILPDYAIHFVKSDEPLFNLPTALVVSHSTDPSVVKLLSFRSQVGVEFGLIDGLFRIMIQPMMSHFGIEMTIKGFICSDTFNNVIRKDSPQVWLPLPFDFFDRFCTICISIIAVALIVLFYEHVYHFATSRGQKKKKAVLIGGKVSQRTTNSKRVVTITQIDIRPRI